VRPVVRPEAYHEEANRSEDEGEDEELKLCSASEIPPFLFAWDSVYRSVM
jgi:hypothetical protein